MTSQKSFKQRVRTRMEKTGESYTSARAQLLPREQEPDVGPTGRPYREWFAELDAWGATEAPHKEIAAWLRTERGVAGWWAQNITVEYERGRGLRAVGQGRDGLFSVGATKTIAVPVEELYAAVTDARRREEWLPGVHLHDAPPRRTGPRATTGATARPAWSPASTPQARASASSRSSTRRCPTGSPRPMKAFWRERLSGLKALLEAR